MGDLTCTRCGKSFSLSAQVAQRYPGWQPKLCSACHGGGRAKAEPARRPPSGSSSSGSSAGSSQELVLPVSDVLARFTKGPHDGVFTDGACSGNPGPGGWGAVYVRADEVVAQEYGHEGQTTNNRMELSALIAGYRMISADDAATLYSDSQLCVRTINEWATQWEARGWRRKGGPVKNLELVQEAYALAQERPKATLCWIKAHDGSRWNEYADALATAYLRDEL